MLQIVYARTDLPSVDEQRNAGGAIFLAGPTPRSEDVSSWRPEAIRLLIAVDFTGYVFIPEDAGGGMHGDKREQREWEWAALEAADAILFWIPRDFETMPGFTTNIEFGYWSGLAPQKVILGAPVDAVKMGYIRAICARSDTLIPTFTNLEETVINAAFVACKAGT